MKRDVKVLIVVYMIVVVALLLATLVNAHSYIIKLAIATGLSCYHGYILATRINENV